nr:helix-turn-helix transcriptional regulator [Kibdelosporangium sp. MJ126-NF4]CEL19987.1 Putative DNA-binding protein [Kibdelosporangium sp. MJ126-NF4]CTQ97211.1 Putative DNA-binding protein [Kibdelosporangium sp. MJ126-NF4]
MPENSRSTFLRRKLGAKLRRMREEAGMSIEEAAPLLDKKRSALQRIEAGETKADVHLVSTMMDKYDQYDPDLLDEVREAAKTPWYRHYGLTNMGYVDVETEADYVHEFALLEVPGLLQTGAYMRALFASTYRRSPEKLDMDIEVRFIRQARLLGGDRPLRLVTVVHEAALHNEVGGPEVMRGQLRRLVEVAVSMPSVTLQVIPQEGPACRVPNSSFILLGFCSPEDPEFLYVEYATGALHIEEENQIRQARILFDQIRAGALSPTESVALIERLIR